MGLVARNPDFVAFKQQRRRSDCIFQHLCCSLYEMYYIKLHYLHSSFNILASYVAEQASLSLASLETLKKGIS